MQSHRPYISITVTNVTWQKSLKGRHGQTFTSLTTFSNYSPLALLKNTNYFMAFAITKVMIQKEQISSLFGYLFMVWLKCDCRVWHPWWLRQPKKNREQQPGKHSLWSETSEGFFCIFLLIIKCSIAYLSKGGKNVVESQLETKWDSAAKGHQGWSKGCQKYTHHIFWLICGRAVPCHILLM